MFAIILIVLGLFYLGGDAQGADVIAGVDPEMWQPANTNALLMLIYGLFGLAVAATVVAAVFQFGAALKDSPANAIKSLLVLGSFAVRGDPPARHRCVDGNSGGLSAGYGL